jgi:hypothetical protein
VDAKQQGTVKYREFCGSEMPATVSSRKGMVHFKWEQQQLLATTREESIWTQ